MNTFIIRASMLIALILGSCVMLYALPTPYSHDLAAIVNKRDLLKGPADRRIIFVGGSGLQGLDSPMIQARCAGCQVVNMGLYGGFGITALLDAIRPYLRSNDVVIIIPEYTVVFDAYDEHARKWIFTLDPARNLMKLYDRSLAGASLFFKDIFGLLKIKLNTLSKVVKEARRTKNRHELLNNGHVYYRDKFNENGDRLTLGPAYPKDKIEGRNAVLSNTAYQEQSFEAVRAFTRFAADKGVQTFFVFPPYPDGEYDLNRESIERFHQRLTRELGMPVLGQPKDFVFPYAYFSDTVNHLTREGERFRNEKLSKILQQAGIVGGQNIGRRSGVSDSAWGR